MCTKCFVYYKASVTVHRGSINLVDLVVDMGIRKMTRRANKYPTFCTSQQIDFKLKQIVVLYTVTVMMGAEQLQSVL